MIYVNIIKAYILIEETATSVFAFVESNEHDEDNLYIQAL